MIRTWIICASCKGTWPMPRPASTYEEMQMMSQPCPRCEAYTLSCVPVNHVSVVRVEEPLTGENGSSLAEFPRAARD